MPRQTPALNLNITVLGGGSRYWCQVLMRDLALCPLIGGHLRLHDLRPPTANVAAGERIFAHPDSRSSWTLSATSSLATALRGTDVVVIGISPGPAAMFVNDLEIPQRYGILQTVGDTTGPGGLSRALRAIPIMSGFAEAIARYAPQAWVINYANPMTLSVAALYAAFPGIRAFGCCHEVYSAQERLAGLVGQHLGVARPDRHRIAMDIAGVNHFTFATAARFAGQDLFPVITRHIAAKGFFADHSAQAQDLAARGAFWDNHGLIAYDFFRRFGALGAAGDRHLAEFVPWYLNQGEVGLHRWGVVATPASLRAGTWAAAPGVTPAPSPLALEENPARLRPSGEEGVAQICALHGLGDLDTNVNLPNQGQIAALPLGAVVETNAQFRHQSCIPIQAAPLPPALHSIVARVVDQQQLVLEAGRSRSFDLALQALLLDPLVSLPTDHSARMLAEMLRANQALLPGWKIPRRV